MKAGGTLFAVRDLSASLVFYREVLGLEVLHDFGANVVLAGGRSLQTLDSWRSFLGKEDVAFGGNDAEIYFEAEGFDAFLDTLGDHPEVELVHPLLEHRWGQRVVRLYDPDRHIVEVGEPLSQVCARFRNMGLDETAIARRMELSIGYVLELLKEG